MSHSILIRPFEASDRESVDALLQDIWAHDHKMLMVYRIHRVWSPKSPRIQATRVAILDGTICGVATLFESTLHPRMLWAAINVAPGCQRQGVGSALYQALEALGDGRPWMVRLTLRDHAGTRFLKQRGFYNPRSQSIMGVLDPRRAEVQRWLEGLPREVPGYTFVPLDAAANPATLEDVARVQAAVYRQYHGWNPPVEESTQAALAHYCGPEVLAGSHLCVFEGEQLIGAANLFRMAVGDETNVAYLAHVGIMSPDRPHIHKLTAALIRRSLEWAAAAGLRVRFEADEWYAPHRALYLDAPADDVDRDFAVFVNA